jgi:6-phosphogluconate dehydrogenase
MVHNGIEYGDMQLIGEIYDFMKTGLCMTNADMHEVFARWNNGKLDSYLVEITRDILAYKDQDGHYVLDDILDAAGQKGTGKWTVQAALDEGQPLTLISEAVFARCLSAMKEERRKAARMLHGSTPALPDLSADWIGDLEQALYASKIISYAQGYQLMRAAARTWGWDLNYGGIALMWRGGCIIRSVFLERIKEAYDTDPNLDNLLPAPFFRNALQEAGAGWRRVVAAAVQTGLPMPAVSSALAWFDGYRRERLPANLLQAQRDYFGAHQYERTDEPRGAFFHTNWTGHGGQTASSAYQV